MTSAGLQALGLANCLTSIAHAQATNGTTRGRSDSNGEVGKHTWE